MKEFRLRILFNYLNRNRIYSLIGRRDVRHSTLSVSNVEGNNFQNSASRAEVFCSCSSNRLIVMSSESTFVNSLGLAQTYLYRFGGPVLTSLGTVSCILSLAVFIKKNLRKNPCTIYLIAYHIASLLLIYTTVLPQTLSKGYNVDPTSYNLTFCRCRFYTTLLFDVLGPSYLILASIDRVLLTSRHALTRQRSTLRLAYVCILCVTLFWLCAQTHTLAFCHIFTLGPGYNLCYFQQGGYYAFISYYTLVVKGLLLPLLLLIFGLQAVKNVRAVGRGTPISVTGVAGERGIGVSRSNHFKDRQLLRILFVDVGVYLFFSLMMSIVLAYQQIVKDQAQSNDAVRIRAFYVLVSVFSGYIPSCIGFYNNLLVSTTFRREAKKVLKCK